MGAVLSFVCGDGAGFYQLSVGIKDMGEPAFTNFIQYFTRNFISHFTIDVGTRSPINFATHQQIM